jgi:hypothetical protein
MTKLSETLLPFAYAYRYPAWPPEGATVIRLGNGGREVNGVKPIETIPLYTAATIEALQRSNAEKDEALAYAESILTAVSSAGAGEALNRVRKALGGQP